jgi:hypothetical protein
MILGQKIYLEIAPNNLNLYVLDFCLKLILYDLSFLF